MYIGLGGQWRIGLEIIIDRFSREIEGNYLMTFIFLGGNLLVAWIDHEVHHATAAHHSPLEATTISTANHPQSRTNDSPAHPHLEVAPCHLPQPNMHGLDKVDHHPSRPLQDVDLSVLDQTLSHPLEDDYVHLVPDLLCHLEEDDLVHDQ